MKAVMIIPSYWSRERRVGWKKGDAIYDHPTPLDETGTLKRLLESISILHDLNFELVILAMPTSIDITEEVEEKVKRIVSSVSLPIKISVIGPSQLQNIKKLFIKNNQRELADLINFFGYSNIRNLCLLIPAIKNADIAILIDDDEMFQDPEFIQKVKEHFIHPIDNNQAYGIAGFYVNNDHDFLINKSFEPWMKFWDKNERMNEAFRKIIGNPPRIKETPFVFGGNMIIPKELYRKIMFDPHVPRGEDIDYLINARMYGYTFYLDNQLSIVHLPPPKSHPTWQRLREDIYRFVYEREKIKHQKKASNLRMIQPEDFDPYPGCFLKDDLEEKIKNANTLLAEEYAAHNEYLSQNEAIKNIDLVSLDAIPHFDPVTVYDQLRNRWETLMRSIQNTSIQSELKGLIR